MNVVPGKTEKTMLPPGKYEVAAELAVDNMTRSNGTQGFGKGTRYRSRFRVEFQRGPSRHGRGGAFPGVITA
ncbi:MAG: hypothetical protein ACO1SX_08005 [Actinomycetota bacterium]